MSPKIACWSALVSLLLASGGARADLSPERPSLAGALDRALADGWNELEIEAECRVEGRLPRVEVYGNGVGIWNDERQFVLSRTEVRELLAAVRDAGFASMRPSYGGKHDPAREDAQAPRLTCRASVRLDGASGEAVQLEGGRQFAELRRLAETILDACREKAAAGTGAADLDDGLAKVASGILAPEVLQVLVSRQPEGRSSTDPARVLTMRVAGRTLSCRGRRRRRPRRRSWPKGRPWPWPDSCARGDSPACPPTSMPRSSRTSSSGCSVTRRPSRRAGSPECHVRRTPTRR